MDAHDLTVLVAVMAVHKVFFCDILDTFDTIRMTDANGYYYTQTLDSQILPQELRMCAPWQ